MFLVRKEQIDLPLESCRRTCLPRRYWEATIAQIPDECSYKKVINKYCGRIYDAFREGIGLYLSGSAKSGKTAAAAIVGKAALTHNATVYFTTAADMVRHHLDREMYDLDQSVQERVDDVNMLILDDLGGEQQNSATNDILQRVVRRVYHQKRLLVLTTALKPSQVKDFYGDDFHKTICSCTLGVSVNGDWAAHAQAQIKNFIEG